MPLNLVAFTKQVTSIMLPAADLKHIDLGYEGSEEVLNIMADEGRLYDLIHNLIDNAIKYTADHGKVTLAVDLKDNKVRLVVEDNGIGIPKEDQTMIYERFYRGDNVNAAGAGVGLAIVKEIADIHNARIEIDSRKDKEGTRFYVYFDLKI
jgi:two-component system sensor histidine kinase TctE